LYLRKLLSLEPIPDKDLYKSTRIEKEIPEILPYLEQWGNNTRILWAFFVFLGIFATFFSLLAATGFGGETLSRVFAFIAALSIAFLTAFNLGAKSNNTRNAWRLLNAAVIRYNQGIMRKDDVINAYERGETLIGGISFSQIKTEEPSAVDKKEEPSAVDKKEEPSAVDKKEEPSAVDKKRSST
jgi:hypothetical protein